MALDASYRPLTYRRAGGDELVVASGGTLIVESGGTISVEAGGLVTGLTVTASVVAPDASDGAALGSGTLMWSDLFLANEGVINFNNGDVTITHAANLLTLGGGGLSVGASDAGFDVIFYGDTVGCNFLWDQNLDTNGGLQLGADTKATHFYAYGATTGNYLKWDAAADDLLLVGTATQLAVAGTATSSSTTTGSLRTAGGLGVVGPAFFGGLVTSNSVTGFRSLPTFVPDATYTNYAFSVGNKVAELTVNFANAADQNFNPIQAVYNVTGTTTGPTNSSQMNGIYQLITHDTTDMANLRLKCADWNIVANVNTKDAYIIQTELDLGGTSKTFSGQMCPVSASLVIGGTTPSIGEGQALYAAVSGAGAFTSSEITVGKFVYSNSGAAAKGIVEINNAAFCTVGAGIRFDGDGAYTSVLSFEGLADGTAVLEDNTTAGDKAGSIKIIMPSGGAAYINVYDGART